MLTSTKAIVLSKVKYRDYDLIVKCYTQQRGLVSYLLNGVLKSTKGRSKSAYYQVLSQLQIEENYRQNQSLHYIKEVKLNHVYESLHAQIVKSTITLFLAEVLAAVLREEEPNEALYSYLETSLLWFDTADACHNFHLLFLLKLTKYLGFYPDALKDGSPYFNLETGTFETVKEGHYTVSGSNVTILKQLMSIAFDQVNAVKLKSDQRQSFLNMLLLYYELHIGGFKKTKSLEIFSQVFS